MRDHDEDDPDDYPWMMATEATWETYQAALAWYPVMIHDHEDHAFTDDDVFCE